MNRITILSTRCTSATLASRRVAAVPTFAKRFAADKTAEPAAGTDMILNFSTPHTVIYKNKAVEKVILPGESGEFGVTVNHSPIISQLAPGLVTVSHLNGENEQFFVPGGFSITNDKSVTTISVTEAFSLSDFSPEAVKSGYENAVKSEASASDEVSKATFEIQVKTYGNLARALGIAI